MGDVLAVITYTDYCLGGGNVRHMYTVIHGQLVERHSKQKKNQKEMRVSYVLLTRLCLSMNCTYTGIVLGFSFL